MDEAPKKRRGGRKKGTPNKRSLGFGELLEKQGVSLPAMLIELLEKKHEQKNGEYSGLSDSMKAKVLLELMEYVYPKRKPIEAEPPPPADPSSVPIVYHTQWGSNSEPTDGGGESGG